MEKTESKIFVMTHKPYSMPKDPIYQPLLVGSTFKPDLEGVDGYLKDDTGDNISEKNKSYCELTGLYWVWKNVDMDFCGLVHYRRLFASPSNPKAPISGAEVKSLLEDTKLVLPRKRHYYIETVQSQYAHAHNQRDLDVTRNALMELCPDYVPEFDALMKKRSLHILNMFIGRKSLVDEYCSWLFPILSYVEKNLDTSGYSDYNKRVFGFLSERLFNVWISHNEIPYRTLKVLTLENQHWGRKVFDFLRRKFFGN